MNSIEKTNQWRICDCWLRVGQCLCVLPPSTVEEAEAIIIDKIARELNEKFDREEYNLFNHKNDKNDEP